MHRFDWRDTLRPSGFPVDQCVRSASIVGRLIVGLRRQKADSIIHACIDRSVSIEVFYSTTIITLLCYGATCEAQLQSASCSPPFLTIRTNEIHADSLRPSWFVTINEPLYSTLVSLSWASLCVAIRTGAFLVRFYGTSSTRPPYALTVRLFDLQRDLCRQVNAQRVFLRHASSSSPRSLRDLRNHKFIRPVLSLSYLVPFTSRF